LLKGLGSEKLTPRGWHIRGTFFLSLNNFFMLSL